jgi:tetratricopeptide (TPR) repeat protein
MDLRSAGKPDPQFQAALEQYESAMKYFSQQKFEKAKSLLEKVRALPYKELADRAAVHLSVCNQRLQGNRHTPRTAEDHYNYAILQMNTSHYDEAEEHLQKALKAEGKTPHVEYALAALHALKNEVDPALVHLKEAIEMDPRNRLLARNDDDFRLLMEDPRFTEIIYPERS